jgi:2-dehydropantoate 2-reductase
MNKDSRGDETRIIIYGAGAIGCAIGGHLALAGKEVLLLGRPGHIEAINRQGLRFITPQGEHNLKIAGFTSPAQIQFRPADQVFLSVKSQDTEGAMRDLKAAVGDIPVFSFQNGVSNEVIIRDYFPRVYGAMIRIGAEYLRDGETLVRRDPPGWVIISRFPAGGDALLRSAALSLRQAGFRVLEVEDAMPYKWGKLMMNLANAVGAITNERGMEGGPIAKAAQQEAAAILARKGIRWISHEETARAWADLNEKPRKVIAGEGQSSTWQSLARRQGSVEAEHLNGEIVRLAQGLGLEAPINAGLLRIVTEMAEKRELPGKYSSVELKKLLGLD